MKIEIEVTESVGRKVMAARGRVGEPYAEALLGAILSRWSDRVLSGGMGKICLWDRVTSFAMEWIGESAVEQHVTKLREIKDENAPSKARQNP